MVTDLTQSKATLIGIWPFGSGLCMSGPQSMAKRIWSRLSYDVCQRVPLAALFIQQAIVSYEKLIGDCWVIVQVERNWIFGIGGHGAK